MKEVSKNIKPTGPNEKKPDGPKETKKRRKRKK